jgi:cell division initiation protein
MRRKKAERQAASAAPNGRVTPIDIQQVEFRLAFRGYNERDVDGFLDRVTEDLSHYLEENQRLRAGAGATAGGGEAPRDEADAILERAREEAAEIVRRAEQEAAAVRSAAAAPGDARAAVAPFLNREREFLQSLGSLVQTHAEEIKQMVLALRARVETEQHAAADTPAEPATDAAPVGPIPEAASAAEIRERLGEPEPEVEPDEVVVDATDRVYSAEGAQAGEGRERSLRELFWGDE